MTHECGVVTVVAEEATSRVAPMFPLDAPLNSVNFALKTFLDKMFKMCSLESVVCPFYNCLNPIFLDGVLPDLINFFRFCASPRDCSGRNSVKKR